MKMAPLNKNIGHRRETHAAANKNAPIRLTTRLRPVSEMVPAFNRLRARAQRWIPIVPSYYCCLVHLNAKEKKKLVEQWKGV